MNQHEEQKNYQSFFSLQVTGENKHSFFFTFLADTMTLKKQEQKENIFFYFKLKD